MLKHSDFVHLHLHTEFSLLDGMMRVPPLSEEKALEKARVFNKAVEFKMPALAMTDHGNLFGALHFYEQAIAHGIKPIIGCEVYVAPTSRLDKSRRPDQEVSHHLILLCQNEKGYRNLCKLVTAGYLEGFYYKPRIDQELLEKHNEGLIALSACLKGELPSLLLLGKDELARKRAGFYRELFRDRRFYIELQENGIPEQARVNKKLVALAKELEVPVVATNDCHYLNPEDFRAHDLLLCIQTGKTVNDENRLRMRTDKLYFRSPDEMKSLFAEFPEAILNTVEVAERCNIKFDFQSLHFPRFQIPAGETLDDQLEGDARSGFELRRKILAQADPEFSSREKSYIERFDYELNIIKQTGFASYFLIVADFINYARSHDIPVGPGRGSAAGSLVAYSLGITDIDPLAYGLIFERFLNPERREMPDIDVDFCKDRRDEVIRYVTERYGGSTRVVQLITFNKMLARAVIRDVGRALDIPYGEVDRIAKLVPEQLHISLEDAFRQEPRFEKLRREDPRVDELLNAAVALESLTRHAGTHAAGIVISDQDITGYMPLFKGAKEDDPVITQFDMDAVQKIGMVKFDLLGLRTLTMMEDAVKLIKKNRGRDVDLARIPLNDPEIYQLLGRGETAGIFQLESTGMSDLLVRLKPDRIEELIAQVALYRPGPLGSKMVDDFIDRKHRRKPIKYLLPQLEEILKETYGVILYQEQVMQIAARLASYTMGEADKFRKAMGKKEHEAMEAERDLFTSRCIKNKIDSQKAEQIFDLISEFAGYGFNKSHSTAYAVIAAKTAYLKAHYPVEFLAALLSSELGEKTEKIVRYLSEGERLGIEILPPHVNTSDFRFIADGDRIIYGLGAVKNVGKSAVEAILEARRDSGPFKSLFDFCDRVDLRRVNRRALESLIKAGALDGTLANRAQMMAVLDQAMEEGQARQRTREAGQTSMLDLFAENSPAEKKDAGRFPPLEEWPKSEILSAEKEVLGFYLTGHPLARHEKLMRSLGLLESIQLPLLSPGREVMIGGLVTALKEKFTRKKERMATIILSDLSGSVEVVVFPKVFADKAGHLKDPERPLIIQGRLEHNEDQVKVLAGEIFPLDEAFNRIPLVLHLTLEATDSSPERLNELKELFRHHQGPSRVMMHIVIPERTETVISLPDSMRVRPDPGLIEQLERMFGPGSASIRNI
jgi:DNA polymerase-3 subunit alpha